MKETCPGGPIKPSDLQFVSLISMHAGVQGWRCRGKRLTTSSCTTSCTAVGHCCKIFIDLHGKYLSLLVVGVWPWAEGAGSKEKAAWRNSNAKGRADSSMKLRFGCPLTFFYHYVKLCRKHYNNQGVQIVRTRQYNAI